MQNADFRMLNAGPRAACVAANWTRRRFRPMVLTWLVITAKMIDSMIAQEFNVATPPTRSPRRRDGLLLSVLLLGLIPAG